MPKFVVSRTLTDPSWEGTTVLTEVAAEVRALKDRFGEIHVIGSGDLVRTLLREDLVDRLNLLLGLEYALVGLIALAAFTSVARRRDEGLDVDGDREPTTAEVPSETPWSSFERR